MKTEVYAKKIAVLGLLSAMSVVLVMALRIPFPPAPFLEYDPANIPILIGTFMYGSGAGIMITILASGIQAMTVSSASGWIGFVMHVLATSTTCFVVGRIYNKNHRTTARLIVANVVGALVMTGMMVVANLIFTPMFMKVPIEQVVTMIAPILLPFNLLKAAINSTISVMIFSTIKKIITY